MFVQNRENKFLFLIIKIGWSAVFSVVAEASRSLHMAFEQT
jgi:hypothetical protein